MYQYANRFLKLIIYIMWFIFGIIAYNEQLNKLNENTIMTSIFTAPLYISILIIYIIILMIIIYIIQHILNKILR